MMTTAPSKSSPSEVSDKLPGIEAKGVHSSIEVLTKSTSGLIVIISLSPANLLSWTSGMSTLSFFFFSWFFPGVADVDCPVFVVSPSLVLFSLGEDIYSIFSPVHLVSPQASLFFICWYFSSTSFLFSSVQLLYPSFSALPHLASLCL
jgi:hypothetical protein